MEHVKELIEALPGVEFVHVSVNYTRDYDKKSGLQPGNAKIYVKGGKKKEIAQVIWMNKLLGVLLTGNKKVKVKDSIGLKWIITFERLL